MAEEYREIEIFDTTCRDGEQSTGGFKEGIESKLLITKKLAELGVSTIEAGFPKSSEGDFNAVTKVAQQVHGPYICALARCRDPNNSNPFRDINLAWDAIQYNEKPTIHVFTFMIDEESMKAYKVEGSDVVKQSVDAVKYAKDIMKGRGRVEFSAQNVIAGIRDLAYEVYSAAIRAGADVVNLPDTAGGSFPDEVLSFVNDFIKNVEGADRVIISTHCHNDLGIATANSIAAVLAGTTQVECTINGIGERAGNASLEEVVMAIRTRKQKVKAITTINTPLLGEISRIVSYHSGFAVQPNKAVVGENAFKHSSGIHQDGVLKGAGYEIMKPETVGWDGEGIEITSRSGRRGYTHRLERLGYDKRIIEQKIEEIVAGGKKLSDDKGKLDDVDLRCVADAIVNPLKEKIFYKKERIVQENGVYFAEITLEVDGKEIMRKAKSSKGAIDALFSAVDSAVGIKVPTLVVYDPKNIGKDHSAIAEVTIVLSDNGFKGKYNLSEQVYIGRARYKDTLRASVQAYINAINRYASK